MVGVILLVVIVIAIIMIVVAVRRRRYERGPAGIVLPSDDFVSTIRALRTSADDANPNKIIHGDEEEDADMGYMDMDMFSGGPTPIIYNLNV